MASAKRGPEGTETAGARRRKRPTPTIELTATEVVFDPVADKPAADKAEPKDSPAAPSHAATDSSVNRKPAWLPFPVSWPMAAAAAVGGVIVLGLLALVGGIGGRNSEAELLAIRLAPLEQQMRELNSRARPVTFDPKTIDDLIARLAKMEAAFSVPRTVAPDPALLARLDSAEMAAKSLLDNITNLNRRVDATAKTLVEIAQSNAERSHAPAVERADIERLTSRMTALEQTNKTLESELGKHASSAIPDRAIRLAAAAVTLRAAVERGAPFATELAAAKRLAMDAKVLAPLDFFAVAGLPADSILARELSALVPAMLRAAGPVAGDDGFLGRLQANAGRFVRIRPVGEAPPGDEPATMIGRIEAKIARADIAGALAELANLSPAARKPVEAWIEKAAARNAALATTQKFAADAFAILIKLAPEGATAQ